MMKRFHLHLHVYDLDANVRFFSALLGTAPTRRWPDRARWVLEDPRLVFSISTDGSGPGLKLLGIEADTEQELEKVREQFAAADGCASGEPFSTQDNRAAEAYWLIDPQGILWEARLATQRAAAARADASARAPVQK